MRGDISLPYNLFIDQGYCRNRHPYWSKSERTPGLFSVHF